MGLVRTSGKYTNSKVAFCITRKIQGRFWGRSGSDFKNKGFSMFDKLFDLDGLVPHGFCLMWRDELFWSLATADTIISLSYFSISAAIALYLIKRQDVHLRWVAVAFALFILLCASSHATDVWTLWSPDYGIQVLVKAATAAVQSAEHVRRMTLA